MPQGTVRVRRKFDRHCSPVWSDTCCLRSHLVVIGSHPHHLQPGVVMIALASVVELPATILSLLPALTDITRFVTAVAAFVVTLILARRRLRR